MPVAFRAAVAWLACLALAGCHRRSPPIEPSPLEAAVAASDSAELSTIPDSAGVPIGPPLVMAVGDIESAPRSNADVLRNADFHLAMDEVRRLRLVSRFQEMRRGLLRVAVGSGFATGTSVLYNFTRLHTAYSKSIDYYGDAIIEVWQNGHKLGEFTRDGMLLGPEYSEPHE